MFQHVKPRVVFSRCLGFESCRYNKEMVSDDVIEHIKRFVNPATVCPEMDIGLGVPRSAVRLVEKAGKVLLLQPDTGNDVTQQMAKFSESFLEGLSDVDGFILKYRSPTCGPSQVKIYNSAVSGAGYRKGAGAFAEKAAERFGQIAIEDEGRLRNFDIRQHFLTKLFTLARFREISQSPSMKAIVSFHARHKLLLMSYNQVELRAMGRIVANPEGLPVDEVFRGYREHLMQAMTKAQRRTNAINVLLHAFGYVSDDLTPGEKAFFLDSLDSYRSKHVPLCAPITIIRSWIMRFETDYLLNQFYFEPFPHKLVQVLDSGKGRKTG